MPPTPPPSRCAASSNWLETQRPNATNDFRTGRRALRANAARHRDGGRSAGRARAHRPRRSRAQSGGAPRSVRAIRARRHAARMHDARECAEAARRRGRRRARATRGPAAIHRRPRSRQRSPARKRRKSKKRRRYARQNFAYIDIPGPYETNLPSVYYIAPPDPTWPAPGAARLRAGRNGIAVRLRARGVARPLPQLPARQPLAEPVRPRVRRLRLRRRLGALHRRDDVGRGPGRRRRARAHRPNLQRAPPRLPLPLGDPDAHRPHDAWTNRARCS